jgi:GTP-binding protein
MFRDEATIEVAAGRGGDGLISFHREKFVPLGGPDGGDGGHGGSILLRATDQRSSLLELGRRFRYSAKGGRPGGPNQRTGGSADDVVIEVPLGTQIFDADRGNLLRDLDELGAELVVAKGGHGGKGNVRFANSIRQSPRHATAGTPGEERRLRLELKLFAEVGLLGFPNAGKSTFLSRVTAARPKVADYPFTTLEPQVGIARVGERCAVLMHLVDVSFAAERDPAEAWQALEDELRRYSPELYAKPRLVVATKHHEDEASAERLAALEEAAGQPVFGISSVLGIGLEELLRAAQRLVRPASA